MMLPPRKSRVAELPPAYVDTRTGGVGWQCVDDPLVFFLFFGATKLGGQEHDFDCVQLLSKGTGWRAGPW